MARFLWDGEVKEITPQHGTVFCYSELRALLAGPLEAIPLPHNEVMLVVADGRHQQRAPNPLATSLVQHFLHPGEMIAGPALVATRAELDAGKALRNPQRNQMAAKTPQANLMPYTPDEQELRDIAELRQQLEPIEQQIAQLEARQHDPHLKQLSEYFHLGHVGGSGRGTSRLNRRREAALDKSIDTAKRLEPLYRQRAECLRRIEAITSGKQKHLHEARARAAQKRESALARILAVQPDEYVIDNLYGIVKVVRVNEKALTIEIRSGHRERRPFEAIRDVYHPQCCE